ncbi:ABC transporter permease [Tabrizicola thermarum]|uniref:ABC transporter permease n=1 Tax=Tabrizicola thermarum TaxID=2670345 RepID=UPI000FFC72F7|nr:ABC transporter permease subunit [Tabrizicola thermarum]
MEAAPSPGWLIARQSARFVLRERTVALLSLMFVVLVLISAWLGWSATSTVNRIYLDAAAFLQKAGQPVPTNPVLDISPLSLMRNMSVYVALIGALSAIVIGNRLIGLDRKAGVLPLIGIRPLGRNAYAGGKIAALTGLILALGAVAGVVAVATFLMLPAITLTGTQWAQLAGFMAITTLYMGIFGLIGLASGAWAKSETVGLLLPVTLWLTLTFILPQLTANLNPTAAINPISALATPPDTSFFHWAAIVLGPVSLADAYKFASAGLLDYLPQGIASPSFNPPVLTLILASCVAAAVAWRALTRLSMTQGDYNV